MLPDWMDSAEGGELTAKDRAAFELHIATCAECSQMLADAQRGAALLEMLKSSRPEPSSTLMDRILANTSGLAEPAKSRGLTVVPSSHVAEVAVQAVNPATYILGASVPQTAPAATTGNVLPFPRASGFNLRAIMHTMMQPRMAMTAAMAFFSIALTLNLTGVHLNELSISDLKPSNLRRTFYQTNASFVRYYDNLRVVYELESRVQELKRSNENDNPDAGASPSGAQPDAATGSSREKSKQDQPHKEPPKAGSGTSQRHSPVQANFMLATDRGRGRPPRRNSFEPLMLTSSINRSTFVLFDKLKKEEKQEGVLA